jgi:hypothetical protein
MIRTPVRGHGDAQRAARVRGEEGPVLVRLRHGGGQHLVIHVDVLAGELGDDPVSGDEQLEGPRAHVALGLHDLGELAGVGGDLHHLAVTAEALGGGDHRAARDHPRAGQPALVDRGLDPDVVLGLGRARADDRGVAAAEERRGDRGDVKHVPALGGRRDPGMVEHEVQRPAGVHVRVAQAGQHRRPAEVDDADGRLVGMQAARIRATPRDAGDPAAVNEDVTVEWPLVLIASAREHADVGQQRPLAV